MLDQRRPRFGVQEVWWLPPLDRHTQHKAIPMLRICLGLVLAASILLCLGEYRAQAFVNIRDTVETAMGDLFQGPVEIRDAELSSLNRVSVKGIVVKDPADHTKVVLEVDELVLRYSILGLVMHINSVEKAINEIVLRNPRLYIRAEGSGQWNIGRIFKQQVSSDGTALALVLRVENGRAELIGTNLGVGAISIGLDGALQIAEALRLEKTLIQVFNSKFTAQGSLEQGNIDLTLKGGEIDLGSVTACFPQTKETILRGKASMEVRASGSLSEPVLDGMISMGKGSMEFPSHDNMYHSIDGLETFFRYQDQILEITKLEIAQGPARFQARGMIDAKGNMRLDILTQAIDLSRNLAFLETYGIAGQANLAGVLSGTILQPDFRGELHVAKGSLRGQSFDELRGHVALDTKDLRITGCNIRKGRSIYAIGGSIGFGPTPEFDITMQSSGGRAEDILAVLRVPGELFGRLDGTVEFRGRRGSMVTEGNIRMSEGRFQDRAFDTASADFIMDAGRLEISQGSIALDGGTLQFAGATQSDGVLLLEVRVENLMADRFPILKDLAHTLEGRIDMTGTASLKGSLAKPWLRMHLAPDKPSDRSASTELDILLQGRQLLVNGRDASRAGGK